MTFYMLFSLNFSLKISNAIYRFITVPTPDMLTETCSLLAVALAQWTHGRGYCDATERALAQEVSDKPADVHMGSCHKLQKSQAPTPQAPIRNRQTRKVASAKGLNRNTNLT